MTATSGPGFSLMQENLGYAAMAETPCVIVNVQRTGPSTGLPTSPAQGDMMQARWGTHGDHPIIALTPSSVRESFDLAVKAFAFSELYRTPVLLMMDEVIAHMREKVDLTAEVEVVERLGTDVPSEWYFPYESGGADVPPLVPFGRGFRYHITGLFHDRAGFPTERLDEIQPWLKRVHAKIERNLADVLLYKLDGVEGARTLVVSYGATARSARHAVAVARARRHKVGFVCLQTIWPFPIDLLSGLAQGVRTVVVPEMNLGQVALEVERAVGRHKVRRDGIRDIGVTGVQTCALPIWSQWWTPIPTCAPRKSSPTCGARVAASVSCSGPSSGRWTAPAGTAMRWR